MVNWNRIVFKDFEEDDGIHEKLHEHGLTFEEAVECFYNPFEARRNKKFKDRFQLIGKTEGGRKLKSYFS